MPRQIYPRSLVHHRTLYRSDTSKDHIAMNKNGRIGGPGKLYWSKDGGEFYQMVVLSSKTALDDITTATFEVDHLQLRGKLVFGGDAGTNTLAVTLDCGEELVFASDKNNTFDLSTFEFYSNSGLAATHMVVYDSRPSPITFLVAYALDAGDKDRVYVNGTDATKRVKFFSWDYDHGCTFQVDGYLVKIARSGGTAYIAFVNNSKVNWVDPNGSVVEFTDDLGEVALTPRT